jgi:hypothetical protein
MDEEREPFITAVVEVADDPAAHGDLAAEDPSGVAMEAAAMLAGADMGTGLETGSEPLPSPGTASDPAAADSRAAALAKVKGYFTRAGFEVSAPVGTSFSIGANQSAFEEIFGERLKVDKDTLGYPVTTADGGEDLPLDPLPPDIRGPVTRIYFMPPPELPPLG